MALIRPTLVASAAFIEVRDAFWDYCAEGNLQAAMKIFQSHSDEHFVLHVLLCNRMTEGQLCPVHVAALHDRREVLRALVQRCGADVNIVDKVRAVDKQLASHSAAH
jgi:aerobic-type carbon monoxide dehydrogenase small subunit (CoxS/CutS family)